MRSPGLWRLCALALMLTGGCAGYHLGPAGGQIAGARSIQIAPFVNHTLEPRLSDYVMMSLRKNLMQDGTYRIDTHDDGDVIMTGEIKTYQRIGLSFQSSDVLTALDYAIIMTAQITVRERSTGKVIFDKSVIGTTSLRSGSDLTSAERQAIPLLTDDLAKKATAMLADGTW
jgi:Lipopolysaccharide-assembly